MARKKQSVKHATIYATPAPVLLFPRYEQPLLDRDAHKWLNKDHATAFDLVNACSYFLCRGWGTEALDDFLDGIEPMCGWKMEKTPSDWVQHLTSRQRKNYSSAVDALINNNYWQPRAKTSW